MTRRGWLLFSTLSLLWGTPYLFIKIAVEHVAPAYMVCLRSALAAACLLPFVVLAGEVRVLLRHWRWVAAFAAVEITVPWGCLGYAETRITSSLTGLLVAAVPLMGALLAWSLRLEDQLDRRRFAGLLVGLAGVAALVGIDVQGGDWLAVLAVLLVAFCYALGPVIAVARLGGVPGRALTAGALGLNALVYAPFAWVTRPAEPGAVPVEVWWSIVFLGVVTSALAFLVFFALVAEVGPTRTTVITYLNPAVAIVLGVLVLSEPLTAGILVGFPLVLLGSWLSTRRSAAAAAPDRAPAQSTSEL
ncbi:DMT family transporter [Kineosporia sp. R_H_3]|uniref:DMT family transporter n=1 Tax=Kineosporia sp. R_H_3 TaxID=1961848 RepID=UPI000B4BF2CB|nr:EamA family transporter [Kineosporia sp. R_H_3]